MTRRYPVSPAPGPLEDYAQGFDDLFGARAQRHAFRRYLEGLLLPAERNKTLTALANTEPVVGAQRKEAQSLQWFLSESRWDPEQVNRRRVELMLKDPKSSAPSADGVLVIDEHGDRKWGKKTAHVGRQWLANIGKTDSGVVSVTSLWADESAYWPIAFEPYTPAHHFEGGKQDPAFRTKLKIARELVELSVEEGIPFRAVVADSFYGEDEDFKSSLEELGVGYVLALKPSHAWWHKIGEIGSPWEAALAASEAWKGTRDPGDWIEVVRSFRDGHEERWWALEVDVGPYGPQRSRRAVVATTDPKELPDKATWYLVSNLPTTPASERAQESDLTAAELSEIVRLYGLRMWVEQSYKQVKHVLGWSDYQVRSDLAIRRHWQLVCCAFTFCWWAYGRLPTEEMAETDDDPPAESEGRGKKEARAILAGDLEGSKGMVGAVDHAEAILEGILRDAPTTGAKSAA
ncbi:MAG: IS701 family transposase [Actinobacteria bacterium]|nr:IS701 family transposase [Actinomycetota bacterium]